MYKVITGKILATPGALEHLAQLGVSAASLLDRHMRGDWGDVCDEDKAANDYAAQRPLRLLSSYGMGPDVENIWIITEADRSVTTVLLPSEY